MSFRQLFISQILPFQPPVHFLANFPNSHFLDFPDFVLVSSYKINSDTQWRLIKIDFFFFSDNDKFNEFKKNVENAVRKNEFFKMY